VTNAQPYRDIAAPLPEDHARALGQVVQAWNMLEWALRMFLVTRSTSATTPERLKEAFGLGTHTDIIERLRCVGAQTDTSDEERQWICQIVQTVGCKRNEALYGRRNAALHSPIFYAENGKMVGYRADGHLPIRELALGVCELDQLSRDIRRVTKELLSKIDLKSIQDVQAGETTQ
jgi:hypothetical protein